jgi:arylsulfatase A-like enzyme
MAVFIASAGILHAADRPNFLVILGEAQGWTSSSVQMDDTMPNSKSDLARTPNLEKLAAGGIRFANFHAASPRCTPTRAALFTGRSPAALHMTFVSEGPRGNGGGGGGGAGRGGGGRESTFSETGSKLLPPSPVFDLPESDATIAEVLKRAGYVTAHFGKWHVGRTSPARHGFDESDGATSNGGQDNVENPNPKEAFGMTERGMDFMTRQAKAGKPFYLQISHYPGRGGTDARPETYASVRQRAKTDRDARQVGNAAVTEDMDATIGMLLAKLDELGIANRTYVIYTSDHGAQGRNANGPLANGKGTVWEGGVRVPLIVRGPGIRAGACSHVEATTVDLFPTIAALARVTEPLPKELEGGNLTPVLAGMPHATVKRPREELVIHFPHYDKDEIGPASAIFLGNLKLIHVYETNTSHLFDLSKDLTEGRDLASTMASQAAVLDKRLAEYLAAVKAQMPAPNPSYDPSKPQPPQDRRGGRGVKPQQPPP